MFIYGHSGESTPEIRIYHDKYNTTFAQTINSQLNNEYNENYDGPVIENIYERVRQQTSDNIIFLSISDGEPAGEDYGGPEAIKEMKRVIEKCKRDGFVTVGIGLQYHRVKDIYQYHTVIKKSDDLVKNVSSLVNRVVKTEFKD
jgi:nitric oxide reductase activation protein